MVELDSDSKLIENSRLEENSKNVKGVYSSQFFYGINLGNQKAYFALSPSYAEDLFLALVLPLCFPTWLPATPTYS